MIDEKCTLQSSDTWELVPLWAHKSIVGCQLLYTPKTYCYEVGLIAKRYTQIYSQDYYDTFSYVASISKSYMYIRNVLYLSYW